MGDDGIRSFRVETPQAEIASLMTGSATPAGQANCPAWGGPAAYRSGTCTRNQAVTTPRRWNQKSWPTTSAASTRGCADCGVGLQSRDTDQAPEQSLNMEMNL